MESVSCSLPDFNTDEWTFLKGCRIYRDTPTPEFPNTPYGQEGLQEICDKAEERATATCNLVTVVIGHTIEGAPEKWQPEAIGYALNLRVAEIDGDLGILADCYIKKDKEHLLQEYSKPSVEIWEEDNVLDMVSLLSVGRPKKDLGHFFAKNKNEKAKYQQLEVHLDKEEIVKLVQETVAEFLKAQNEEEKPEDEKEKNEEECKDKHEDEKPEDEKAKNEDEDKEENEEEEKEPAKNKYQMLATENSKMRSAISELTRKVRRAEREKDLVKLESEGIQFNVKEELEYVTDLEDKAYETHKGRMKRLYAKAPVGVKLHPAAVNDFGGEKGLTQGELDRVINAYSSKKMTKEEALSKLNTK